MNKKRLRLAVVDDEPDFLKIFKLLFTKEVNGVKCDLIFFNNGQECCEYLKSNPKARQLDAILTDLNMPLLDGFGLIKCAREALGALPIFVLSAYGTKEKIEKAISTGANEFFIKPIDMRSVKQKLDKYLFSPT